MRCCVAITQHLLVWRTSPADKLSHTLKSRKHIQTLILLYLIQRRFNAPKEILAEIAQLKTNLVASRYMIFFIKKNNNRCPAVPKIFVSEVKGKQNNIEDTKLNGLCNDYARFLHIFIFKPYNENQFSKTNASKIWRYPRIYRVKIKGVPHFKV